ncbi:DUF5431 family protein [Escherichia coli]|nr:DUF5431 family protein [Escherichia coli]EJG7402458.1 DUF5431 family protein [Escherichia coli]EKQ0375943.1 DUF5431 family protein [Escherichia coli]HCP4464576.1 DUF5431 family protein [Escherichia coli]
MSSPHQDSLLPRFAQGEEGHAYYREGDR